MTLPDEWFETEGKRHFRDFCRMVEAAYREGLARGMRVKKADAAAMMELYRGRGHGAYKGFREDRERIERKKQQA